MIQTEYVTRVNLMENFPVDTVILMIMKALATETPNRQ